MLSYELEVELFLAKNSRVRVSESRRPSVDFPSLPLFHPTKEDTLPSLLGSNINQVLIPVKNMTS